MAGFLRSALCYEVSYGKGFSGYVSAVRRFPAWHCQNGQSNDNVLLKGSGLESSFVGSICQGRMIQKIFLYSTCISISLLLRALIGLHSYSGSSSTGTAKWIGKSMCICFAALRVKHTGKGYPPQYGDYEAQKALDGDYNQSTSERMVRSLLVFLFRRFAFECSSQS